MSEEQADLDSLLGDVKLDGEDDAPAPKAKPQAGDPPEETKDDKPSVSNEKRADQINKRLIKAMEKHLANPDLPCLLVDILDPGTATVNLNLPELTPAQHALIAFGGIILAVVATNPEVLAKLKNGLKRKDQKQKKLPEGAAGNAVKDARAAPKETTA